MDDELKQKETASSLRKIHGKALIDYTIEALEFIQEIDEIFVVTNGLYYEKFNQWLEENSFTKKVTIVNDNTTSSQAKLGAIGDIRFTINTQNIEEDLMVLAGDVYFDFSLQDFVSYYQEKKVSVVAGMVSPNVEDLTRYGVIEEENGKIVDMQEKPIDPQGNIISLAAYIYPKDVLRDFEYYLNEGNLTTYPGYFVEYLYKIKDVLVYKIEGNYYDVKTLQNLQELEHRLDSKV